MTFGLGFLSGLVMASLVSASMARYEWKERRKLQNRVDWIYTSLACGKGFFGCKGGPNCPWEHK